MAVATEDGALSRRRVRPDRRAGAALLGGGALLLTLTGGAFLAQGLYIPLKAAFAQVLLEHAWDRSASRGGDTRPWPWADTHPVARLSAPRLGAEMIVLAGGQGRTLAFGPGHVDGTARPGHAGHGVVGGHRDTHFRFLRDLVPGDTVEAETPDGEHRRYRVIDRRVFDIRTETLALEPGSDLLTLVTCYPFDNWRPGGPLRYAVTAEAVPQGR